MSMIDFTKLAKRPRWWRILATRLFWPAPIMIHGGELDPNGAYYMISDRGLWTGTLDWYEGASAEAARKRERENLMWQVAQRDGRVNTLTSALDRIRFLLIEHEDDGVASIDFLGNSYCMVNVTQMHQVLDNALGPKWSTLVLAALERAEAERDALSARVAVLEDSLLTQNDKIEGLTCDLRLAVETAYHRGATEWTRLNYPRWFAELEASQ